MPEVKQISPVAWLPPQSDINEACSNSDVAGIGKIEMQQGIQLLAEYDCFHLMVKRSSSIFQAVAFPDGCLRCPCVRSERR
jgi:hypothetical protein